VNKLAAAALVAKDFATNMTERFRWVPGMALVPSCRVRSTPHGRDSVRCWNARPFRFVASRSNDELAAAE
jgi:hypothetical protein